MPINFSKPPSGADPSSEQPTPKVLLTKERPKVSLNKDGEASGVVRVNLNWTARPPRSLAGLFGRRGPDDEAVDLDLGCLYHFTDGCIGVVQSLGRTLVSMPMYGPAPVIRLDGDDRSGQQAGGENLFVDLSQLQHIRRVLVFASIYAGATNWATAAGVVTMYPQNAPEVEIRLDEPDPSARHCAIALLENKAGQLSISREMRYFRGNQDQMDQAYGWGLRWTFGYK